MVRRIFVSDISEIDFDNFGAHFSADNNYRHNSGGSSGATESKRYEVRAIVESAEINEMATRISNEEYPHEKEVVLDFNQELDAKVVIVDRESGYFVGSHNGEVKKINTGTRSDKWVNQ